ncbi:hypothetical protein SEA_ZETA1847_57 [Microbacterium phage Zeta1847]|uniref:Uncharacterized protein n=1 Tax=Microbacterium phage Zeta1847 TaxID=2201444 RepID=A0A2Z4Q9M7_9CAUD|nr:hypothetical protein HOT46_gp57 [Microbacterium phage Zeta1847]AWY06691.1 hypothetical protein SEA_ZETA1847_57 [Microbacterium phage Zeta1847]
MSARGLFPAGAWLDETRVLDTASADALRRKRNDLKALAFPFVYSSNATASDAASTALSEALERAVNAAVEASTAKREAELVEHFARRYGVEADPDVVRRILAEPCRARRHREEAATPGTALHALLERQRHELAAERLRIAIDDAHIFDDEVWAPYVGTDDGLRTR